MHHEAKQGRKLQMVTIPTIGSVVGGCRIDSLIGEGGMGTVYRSTRISDGSVVALKLLSPELARNEAFRRRFRKESELVSRLDHPHIVPVFEAGESDGAFYIAMRLVEGTDLKRLIEEEGKLDPERTLKILRQVSGAVDSAHAAGLVHRDVKPQNVLLETCGGEEQAFLCDFGLTREAGAHTRLTRTGELVGSTHYMAPEQIEASRDIDRRCDVYALGCVLYECLTGRVPFEKDSEVGVLWAHMNSAPPSVTLRRRELPSGIDDVVARAMAKLPQERFHSCRDMSTAFEQALTSPSGRSFARRSSRAGSQVRAEKDLWRTGPGSLARQAKVPVPATPGGGLGWVVGLIGIVVAVGVLILTGADERAVEAVAGLVTRSEDPAPQLDAPIGTAERKEPSGKTAEDGAQGTGNQRRGRRVARRQNEDATEGDQDGSQVTAARGRPQPGAQRRASTLPTTPPSGTYTYAQNGYMRNCDANGTCSSGDDPPPKHNVQVARRILSEDRMEVTTSTSYSSRWEARFVTEHTRRGAVITEIAMNFNGIKSVTLEPQPTLEWLRTPLTGTERWSVDWSDSDDRGSLDVRNHGRQQVKAAGRFREALRMTFDLTFGPDDYLQVDLWVDPATRMVLKTVGIVRATGGAVRTTYVYSFTSTLRSGPGY